MTRVACDGDDGPGPAEESIAQHNVILALRGRFVFRDRAERTVISPMRALVLRPGDTYRIEHPDGDADVCLSVKGPFLADLTAAGDRTRAVPAAGYAAVQRLLVTLAAGQPVGGLAVEETVSNALGPARSGHASPGRDRAIAEAIAYVVELRFGERLALSDLAATAGVSVFHACRAFRRAMHTSIHRYQQNVRLRHALALLLDSSMPLARIAVDSGFANQGHLGNMFRRRFGLTPARVRLTGFGGLPAAPAVRHAI